MFKIIQTTEKNKTQLSIIPKKWEKNGTLYWPKTRADKLIKDPNSIPEDNWFEMPCSLKRSNLDFKEAEDELDNMLNMTDTDTTEETIINQSKKRVRVSLPQKKNPVATNFNNLALHCLQNSSPVLDTASVSISAAAANSEQIVQDNQYYSNFHAQEIINNDQPLTNIIEEPVMQDLMLPMINLVDNDKSEIIIKNQKEIIKNQKIIMSEIAGFNVVIDELLKKFDKQSTTHSVNQKDQIVIDFKPINSKEEIDDLEIKLQNEEFMTTLLEKFMFICGKSGKEYGLNVCYTLIDNIFSRDFMTFCSWAGGSRGEKEKIAFKVYKNVINFFFKLVQFADNNFTLDQCEIFFKNILKNSTRRNETKKNSRSSRCKRRPKNLKYKSKEEKKNDEIIEGRNEEDSNKSNNEEDHSDDEMSGSN